MARSGKGGTEKTAESVRIGVGLIAAGGGAARILEACERTLRDFLQNNFPGFRWILEREKWEGERGPPGSSGHGPGTYGAV